MTRSSRRLSTLAALAALAALEPTALAALEAPGTASARAAQEPAAPARPEVTARPSRQVLHLADGRVLREAARWNHDHWEIRHGGTWKALPVDAVVRARSERDLLSQAQKLGRETKGDPVRRSAYAEWLVREGLVAEALAALDDVLANDPDQPDALAVLRRSELHLALPDPRADAEDALGTFLRTAARFGPAARELAADRLFEGPEIAGLQERLTAELTERTAPRRELAAHLLRRGFPGRELQPLLRRALLDPNERVRRGASQALGAVQDPAVITPVVRALGSRHHVLRTNATQALGAMNYAAAVPPLVTYLTTALQAGGAPSAPRVHVSFTRQLAYIQDFDVEVAQASSIADPVVNVLTEGEVLDAAVRGVTEYQLQTERAGVRRALRQLTGANPGNTTAAWSRWWQANGEEWMAGHAPPGPPSTPRSPGR